MDATDNTKRVDETIDRVKSSAHETVEKAADAGTQAAGAIGQKGKHLRNAEQQFVEDCRG